MKVSWFAIGASLLMVLAAVPAVSAHNFIGVYDSAKATFTSLENTGRYWASNHCDSTLDTCSTQGFSPIQGFSFLDGRDNLFFHYKCDYLIENADFDTDISVAMGMPSLDRNQNLSDLDRCTVSVDEGESVDYQTAGHAAYHVPNDDLGFEKSVTAWMFVNGNDHSTTWLTNWIKDAPADTLANLEDPSAEATYGNISENASEYVIEDPSGDDELYVDGQRVLVEDGVPVIVGDVTITRTDATDGKNWTIEHMDELSISARIQNESPGRVTEIKSFEI